jgi:tRNA (cmo5U34)-methyltransferase
MEPRTATTTILFSDLVNLTELLQRVGDEQAQHIFNAHRKLLQEAVAANGGQEVKWEGDGVMAAFSSTADAVRCAIAIQHAARRPTAGEGLEVRVGLNAGEALRHETDYFGTAVVVARRLCDRAKAEQILCSGLVAGLLSGHQSFKFRDCGRLELKGVAEPVPTYEVLYEKDQLPYDWTEEDSELYRQIAAVAVPAREEQIATLLALLPFDQLDSFHVLDLGCGEGTITFAILDYFPNAWVTALEGSPSMRAHAAECLRRFGQRATVEAFDLASWDWLPRLESADCAVSSLVLHHLSDGDKARLFKAVYEHLTERGAFLIADVVEPQRPEQRALFGEAYDRVAKAQSIAATGSDELFRKYFCEGRWNVFRCGSKPGEYHSPLFEQLTWLEAAGFEVVDCFWLQAGFAVYGGYKAGVGGALHQKPFGVVLRSAEVALNATSGTHFRGPSADKEKD